MSFGIHFACFLVLFTMNGCKSSSSSESSVQQESSFVIPDSGGASVQFYASNAVGNTYPTRVIFGAATQLDQPTSVAYSESYDELYVCDTGENAVFVYPLSKVREIDNPMGDGANIAPRDIIKGLNTTLNNPVRCRVSGDKLYVLDTNRVVVFDLDALTRGADNNTLNMSPTFVNTGGVTNPLSLAADFVVDENLIYVTSNDEIHIFPTTANGATEPTRILTETNEAGAFNQITGLYKYFNLIYVLNRVSGGDAHVTSYYYVDSQHSADSTVELSIWNDFTAPEYQDDPKSLHANGNGYSVLNLGALIDTSSVASYSLSDLGPAVPLFAPLMGANVQLVSPTDLVSVYNSLIE